MASCAVVGANVTVASASVNLRSLGGSTVLAASVMTGSVLHMMGKFAMIVATVTVGCVSVMKAGLEMLARSRRSVACQARRAGSSAKTNRGWSVPTEEPATVEAAYVTTKMAGAW